ncbi:hypothetical protein CR513_55908, partial [Mucuna pruriens]
MLLRCPSRKFLSFMLTERGIEANPEKCQAIINMRSSQSVREMSEIEEAFLRLKAMLVAPPILTRLTPSIPLLIYIFASDALSTTIVQEKKGKEYPVYFTSEVLQGVERRYQKIEKVALALIITLRRLHPYFQGYNIIFRTDLPIWQVL